MRHPSTTTKATVIQFFKAYISFFEISFIHFLFMTVLGWAIRTKIAKTLNKCNN